MGAPALGSPSLSTPIHSHTTRGPVSFRLWSPRPAKSGSVHSRSCAPAHPLECVCVCVVGCAHTSEFILGKQPRVRGLQRPRKCTPGIQAGRQGRERGFCCVPLGPWGGVQPEDGSGLGVGTGASAARSRAALPLPAAPTVAIFVPVYLLREQPGCP